MLVKSAATAVSLPSEIEEKPYTANALAFILTDVQLFLLIFPFTSFVAALPALGALEALINALNALLLALSVGYLLLMTKPHLSVRHCALFFLFAAYLVASVFWSDSSMRANSISYTSRTILTALQAYVMVVICLERKDYLFVLLKRYAIIIALLSLAFLFLFPTQATWTVDDTPRAQSFFSSPNNMGQFLAFAFLIINFYKGKDIPLPFLLALDAILLYQFYRCDSMTSLGGITVILICYYVNIRLFLRPLFALILIAGLGIPHLSKLRSGSSNSIGLVNRDLTFTGRSDIWDIELRDLGARHRETFGFGSGGYWGNNAEDYNPVATISDLDFDPGQGHNGYLDIYVMGGIVGLLLFMLFILQFISAVFKRVSLKDKVVYFFTLIIFFNNITESSFFRAKHFYFVLLMLIYWYVNLTNGKQEEELAVHPQ